MKAIKIALVVSAFTVSACGGSFQSDEDAQRQLDRENGLSKENYELKEDLRLKTDSIKRVFATENSIWAVGAVIADYSAALQYCHSIGMDLPTQEQADELRAAAESTNEAETTDEDEFAARMHIANVTMDADDVRLPFCRRDHNKSIAAAE